MGPARSPLLSIRSRRSSSRSRSLLLSAPPLGGAPWGSSGWDLGGGRPGGSGPSPSHIFTSTGSHTVTLTVTDSNGQSDTATRDVFINATDQPPSSMFLWGSLDSSNPNQVSLDADPSADVDGTISNYAWDFGDGTSGTGVLTSHPFAAPGTYPVRLTVTDNGGLTGSTCELVTTGQLNGGFQPCPILTITASDAAMTYGGSPPPINATYDGFVGGDTAASLTAQPTCSSTATPTTAVGAYAGATSCSGAVDAKYVITYRSGSLTVNPAPLNVTADDQAIVYGDPVPTLTYQIAGFVNGQVLASSGVTGGASCSTAATATSPAGAYAITCAAGTLAASNYSFLFVPGTLSIFQHSATLKLNGQMFFSTGAGTTSVVNLLGSLTPAAGGNPDVTLAAPVFNLYRHTNTSMTTPDATCAGVVSSTGVVSCSLTGVGIDNWTVVLQLPGTDGYFTARASDPIVTTAVPPTPAAGG